MATFNVVRFRARPGFEQRIIDTYRDTRPTYKGYVRGNLIKTGERTFCIIGEWRDTASLVAARPQMIAYLDGVRHMLEDLGGDLGVTDPVSGEAVVTMGAAAAKKKTKRKAKKKSEKKAAKKKPGRKAPKAKAKKKTKRKTRKK